MRHLVVILAFCAAFARPLLANQSATFRSQSTQGWAWQGLSDVTFERINITIHPDHLDVEHELHIDARSNWDTPSHPNSLEIVGNLNMAKGAVVTGLLLWNGDIILKGKLQTKAKARRSYEEVVDRNVKDPPLPRDPAILEKTGEDSYALSIFPVALNGKRKLRLRYLVPSAFRDSAHRIPFPHAFSTLATVTLKGGPGTPGYSLTSERMDGSLTTVKNEDAADTPLSLEPEAYSNFRPRIYWETGSRAWLRHVTPLFKGSAGSRVCVGSMRDAKGVAGHVSHFVFRPPADFISSTPDPKTRIVAAITDGADTVEKEVTGYPIALQGAEELRIFSRAALEEGVTWRRYVEDSLAEEVDEKPLVIDMEDGIQYARSFGGVPFYPMAKTMPPSLAAAWGFVDIKYALLALEKDSLKSEVAKLYEKSGVPGLDPEDIFPEDGLADSVPISVWLLQRNQDRDELLKPLTVAASALPSGIRWRFSGGSIIVEIDKAALSRGLRVSLHGLDGRLLKAWGKEEVSRGRLTWSPREAAYGAGVCLLRIVSGSRAYSARVVLR